MMKWFYLEIRVVLISCFAAHSAWAIPVPNSESQIQPASIRVRLEENATRVQIRGFDLRLSETQRSAQGQTGWAVKLKAQRMTEWLFTCRGARIHAIRKADPKERGREVETGSAVLQNPALIRSPAGFLSLQGKPYREEVRIYSRGSTCEVVNTLDVEYYLEGLVNSEFNSNWTGESQFQPKSLQQEPMRSIK